MHASLSKLSKKLKICIGIWVDQAGLSYELKQSMHCFDQKLKNRLAYLILMSFLSFLDNFL